MEKSSVLYVRCREEVKKAFRRYALDYRNYEEALISLLRRAGVWDEDEIEVY